MTQFGRTVSCIIGRPGQVGIEINNLRVGFEVIKADDQAINTAKINIYGMGEANAQQSRIKDTTIQLKAGYGDVAGLIFFGDITRSLTKREAPEVICEIESGDGNKARSKSVALTLKGEQSLGPTFEKLAKVAGLAFDVAGVKKNVELPTTIPTGRGLVLAGNALGQVNRIARLNKLDWTIEDGRLIVMPKGRATTLPALDVNANTGMIGSPQAGDNGRLKVKMLLNPEARLRRLVRVQSRRYDGWYLIRRIKHWGDSGYDTAFYTEVECTEVKV